MGIELRKDEEVIKEVNIHWSNYILTGTWATFGLWVIIFNVISESFDPRLIPGLLSRWSLVCFTPLLWKLLANKCKTYIVTNKRFYYESGILTKDKIDIPYSKINDIQLKQTIFQRIFGAGNILIYTGNDSPISIIGIDNPNELKNRIFDITDEQSNKAA